jgi:SAM-dependent methyltransferase
MPNEIVPVVLGDDSDPKAWIDKFEKESLDLIVSNCSLQFVNDLEGSLSAYRDTLIPDGVFLASAFGGDTL